VCLKKSIWKVTYASWCLQNIWQMLRVGKSFSPKKTRFGNWLTDTFFSWLFLTATLYTSQICNTSMNILVLARLKRSRRFPQCTNFQQKRHFTLERRALDSALGRKDHRLLFFGKVFQYFHFLRMKATCTDHITWAPILLDWTLWHL